jgi:LPXTG-motif cell wall-anchored protein
MNRFFLLGLAFLTLVGSGCATRGYARRQAAKVNDRLSTVQAKATAYSGKHDTDLSGVNQRIDATNNKIEEAVASAQLASANAALANTNAAKAEASAARADASASEANANAAQADTAKLRADLAAAQAGTAKLQADVAAAQATADRALAQSTAPPAVARRNVDGTLPKTGSPFPLFGLSGLLSLGAAGVLRLFRRWPARHQS